MVIPDFTRHTCDFQCVRLLVPESLHPGFQVRWDLMQCDRRAGISGVKEIEFTSNWPRIKMRNAHYM